MRFSIFVIAMQCLACVLAVPLFHHERRTPESNPESIRRLPRPSPAGNSDYGYANQDFTHKFNPRHAGARETWRLLVASIKRFLVNGGKKVEAKALGKLLDGIPIP